MAVDVSAHATISSVPRAHGEEKVTSTPTVYASCKATDAEGPICVLSVPVLSRHGKGLHVVRPVVEVYASMRRCRGTDELNARRSTPLALVPLAVGDLSEAVSGACKATRVAARSAVLAEQGAVPQAQADVVAALAESARTQVGELAIAAALAQGEVLTAQIAMLDRQLASTEMRASVASLLMARDAQVGVATISPQTPMFILVHDDLSTMRADVFEEDLLHLVSGQNVTLTFTGSTETQTGPSRREDAIIDLWASLQSPRAAALGPSKVVRGMFLSAEVLGCLED